MFISMALSKQGAFRIFKALQQYLYCLLHTGSDNATYTYK